MNMLVARQKSLSYLNFWKWLQDHPNCIRSAGWGTAVLFDQPELHWLLFDEEDGRSALQLVRGKSLVGELVFEGKEVDEVQVGPDPDAPESFVAELLTSLQSGREVIGHVALTHGLDDQPGHPELRH